MKQTKIKDHVKPLKKNGHIITMEDQKYGIEHNRCSHYLRNQKLLLIEGFKKSFFSKNKTLIRGYNLQKNKLECKHLSLNKICVLFKLHLSFIHYLFDYFSLLVFINLGSRPRVSGNSGWNHVHPIHNFVLSKLHFILWIHAQHESGSAPTKQSERPDALRWVIWLLKFHQPVYITLAICSELFL
jgi:hypothetical protein